MMTNKNIRGTRHPFKRQMPLLILGAGFLLIVVLLVSFFPMTGKVGDEAYIRQLEERVAFLEKQMVDMTPALERMKGPDARDSQMERLNTACQRLEASLTLKSNLLADRMDQLEAKFRDIGSEKKTSQVKTPVAKSEVKQVVRPEKKSPRYHVVEKGDTFYSISRRYDITLKRLKELNRFSEKTTIYPGQKIIVAP